MGLFWASGVQKNLPISTLYGWTQCYVGLYSDMSKTQDQILAMCPGSKLLLACRPAGDSILTLAAMAWGGDVAFMFPAADNTGTHIANGVGWYMSISNWGFAPAGDIVWKGPMDVVGIDPNSPGPDGDKRMSWLANSGQMWVGYRCGFDASINHPGFDYQYERVVFSAP